jgi:hypothetical protein
MACYVSSNDNRLYAALESSYGTAASITGANRIPAVEFAPRQFAETRGRRDKTGSRTFAGLPAGIRRRTEFRLSTYLTSWAAEAAQPSEGALFEAAMGGNARIFAGGTVSGSAGLLITFAAAHGLQAGQAIEIGGELRFAAAIPSAVSVALNAPFSLPVSAGDVAGRTVTYGLATELKGLSVYDYWSPAGAVQRLLCGAAVNRAEIRVNDDFHEFGFEGPAKDLLDNVSFESGQAGLSNYPAEPATGGFDYSIVPGHLGQVWLGSGPSRFYTLTGARVGLDNGLDLRAREFGSDFAQCIVGGERRVELEFSIFERDDAATQELYQAARQRSPVGAMIQLGQQANQLFGVYMPALVPEVPEFDDRETRLGWKFRSSRAQGSGNDELYVAFG